MSYNQSNIKLLLNTLLLVTLSVACQKKEKEEELESNADTSYYVVESAMTTAGHMAYAAEAEEVFMQAKNAPAFSRSAPHLSTACDYATARSSCSNLQTTIDWNGCTLSHTTSTGTSSATLSGIITETYSGFGAASCLQTGNGSNVTRTISATSPWVLTFASGATLTRDMDPGTAFDDTTFPSASTGTSITRHETGTSNGLNCDVSSRCYQIEANGLHTTFKGPKGRTWFEHILTSDVSFTGSRENNDRTMAGTATVWHELSQYKAVNTFNNVLWGSSSCCYPTSGTISTTLTGSLSDTLTMTFSATCGEASLTSGSNSTPTPIYLTQCSE